MTYKDMTFCADRCANKICIRNAWHVPSGVIASWSNLKDTEYCTGWHELPTSQADRQSELRNEKKG